MKIKKSACFVLAIALSGCLPSLHPLYTEDTLVFSNDLLGTWVDDDTTWEFRDGGDKAYDLRVFDGKEGRFVAHLVRLENMLFLDIYPADGSLEGMQDFFAAHLVPAHTFMRVERIGSELMLRLIDVEKVGDMLKDNPTLLKHELTEKGLVLTDSPEALQAFLIAFGGDEDLFEDAMEMTRRVPLYTRENLIFVDSLLGRWKDEEGNVVEVARQDELTYHITSIPQDGTRLQCLANLVQVGDIRLLAVFLDGSAVDVEGSGARSFVPDVFMQVGGVEPELLLRELDYDDAAGLLGSGPEPEEKTTPDEDRESKSYQVFHRI